MSSTSDLSLWLADSGLRNLPLEELIDNFARRLGSAGVPVARIFVGMNTLHPLVLARSLIWDRATGPATRFEFQDAEIDQPAVQQSPFAGMLKAGTFEQRLDLRQAPPGDEVPVFAELRGLGLTDWLGSIFPFGELANGVDGPRARGVGQLWLVSSVATDAADGFDEAHLAVLREVLPVFALAVKAVTMRAVGQGLLESYLGADPASRVLSGKVLRGEVHEVEAVLFYADLRDFTALADTLPGRELIALLDDCFDCMVRPMARRGGEVLKFLGDGLLAIFRTDGRRRAETCAAAAADSRGHLVSLGRHRLRGVREETELFTLAR